MGLRRGKTNFPNRGEVGPADRWVWKACGARLYPVEEENERMYLLEKLEGKYERAVNDANR